MHQGTVLQKNLLTTSLKPKPAGNPHWGFLATKAAFKGNALPALSSRIGRRRLHFCRFDYSDVSFGNTHAQGATVAITCTTGGQPATVEGYDQVGSEKNSLQFASWPRNLNPVMFNQLRKCCNIGYLIWRIHFDSKGLFIRQCRSSYKIPFEPVPLRFLNVALQLRAESLAHICVSHWKVRNNKHRQEKAHENRLLGIFISKRLQKVWART